MKKKADQEDLDEWKAPEGKKNKNRN